MDSATLCCSLGAINPPSTLKTLGRGGRHGIPQSCSLLSPTSGRICSPTTAASAVRVLTSLRDKRINGRTSRQTFLKLYDKHGEALKPYALRARDVDRRLATGTVAAITYVLQELMGDAASADKFFHLMHDGSVIEDVAGIPTHVLADKGNPVRMVREWRLKGMRHVNATLLATLAAVNDMREGSSWKRIRSEELPVLDGLDVNLI